MQVFENGNWYDIQFEYSTRIINAVKEIPGRWYESATKMWKVPRSERIAVENLLARFGKTNTTALQPQIIGEIPELPELTVSIPLKIDPYPYQKRGIAYALENKRIINGDQPGLGKTLQSIGTAVASGAKCILVICPSSLKENWSREFMKFAGWKAAILTDSIKDTWTAFHKVAGIKVFITNYESLKKYFVHSINQPVDEKTGKLKPLRVNHIKFKDTIATFDMVIIDELHRLKDGTTKNAKYTMGITAGKEWVLGLTGTPVVNKPKDLVSQLHIIGRIPDMGGYKHFIDRYCEGGNGSANLAELNYKLKTTCFYQRKKTDVLKDLPAKSRQILLTEIDNMSEYNKAIHNLALYLKDFKGKTAAEIDKSMKGEVMVQIGVLKAISARGKISTVQEHIDEVIGAGEKIGVFVHQKEIAKELKRIYPDALTITGDDSNADRDAAVQSFQNDPKCKVIILSIKAAGVGLTLTAASRCVFVELPWHAADCDQCEDRFHRIGQLDNVQATYLLGKDTIDEHIYKIIEKKREVANDVMGVVNDVQEEVLDMMMNTLFGKKAA